MMSKIINVIAGSLDAGDEIECAFPSQHERTSGYIIFSKKKMFFAEEDHLTHGVGHSVFEIPLWAISSIELVQDQFVTTVNDGDNYSFESIFANEVKDEFEKLKSEALQETVMPLISQI
ncbi:MAG: hypothetical protein QG670_702 [Thermoproteota archaeon]|nr:hypothetical protein [Thermoproteota archaeon]